MIIQNTVIAPASKDWLQQPHLDDYESVRQNFRWEQVEAALTGLPEGNGLNIAFEAADRHVIAGKGTHIALRWLSKDGNKVDVTYQQLSDQSNQFANVLQRLGVGKEDTVFLLSGRTPEVYVTALGTLKNRSVFCPLFAAFGPEPIHQRLSRGAAKVVVTTTRLFDRKVMQILDQLPEKPYVLLIDAPADRSEKVRSLPQLMADSSPVFEIPPTSREDRALLHFTSGTTGMPKGAVHVHQSVYTHYITGKYVLDFHPHDIFWCTADPGWVTGTSYGIMAPLVHGIMSIIDEAEFNAERWFNILEEEKVSIWYTAPTAIRRLMRLPGKPKAQYDLSALRLVLSVGEPLNPEAVFWGREALGKSIHDNWWQTETGGIMISNFPALAIKPGSMGKPIPGIEAGIIRHTKAGQVEPISVPGEVGELALKVGWPSMFRAYLHQEERYQKSFVQDWYLSGDLAYYDEDGYYWFVGRADDMIKTAGHVVGPFEVESTLLKHPAVAEAAVIGTPDPLIGEKVKAFVLLHEGFEPTEELRLELIGFGRKILGSAIAPKDLAFSPSLPKTRSGKIMRRLIKARELGLPEGDTSTLETD